MKMHTSQFLGRFRINVKITFISPVSDSQSALQFTHSILSGQYVLIE